MTGSANLGGTGKITLKEMVRDSQGNVYVIGHYTGSIGWGHLFWNATFQDIFMAKYDKFGKVLWLKPLGGAGDDAGVDIDIDNAGNIYICGYFHNTVDFNPDPVITNSSTTLGGNGFFAKYNGNGEYIFHRAVSNQANQIEVTQIAVDKVSQAIYYAGTFLGSANFNYNVGGNTLLTSAGDIDIFFANATANGQFVYAKRLGNVFYNLPNDMIYNNGGIFITSTFNGTLDSDPNAGVVNLVDTVDYSGFIGRYSASTGSLTWSKMMYAGVYSGLTKLAIGSQNELLVAGYWSGNISFDPGNLNAQAYASNGYRPWFILTLYPPTGTYFGATTFSTENDNSVLNDIVTDDQGNAYVAISYTDNMKTGVIYDPNSRVYSKGETDVIIYKLDEDQKKIWFEELKGYSFENNTQLVVSPNGQNMMIGFNSNSLAVSFGDDGILKPAAFLGLLHYWE